MYADTLKGMGIPMSKLSESSMHSPVLNVSGTVAGELPLPYVLR